MRLLFVGFILLFATPSVALAQRESPNRADWGQWARAFSAYADYPSDSNADALRRAFLPSARGDTLDTPPPFDSVADWLAMLARQVEARDAGAVRLAFEIEPSMGSGDFSERLDIILGKLIRIDPRLFLAGLRAQEQRQSNVGVPGGNLGAEYVDRTRASCREFQLRILALQRVTERGLQSAKARSIAEFTEAVREECR